MDIIENHNNNYNIPSHFHPLMLTSFHPKPRKKRTPKVLKIKTSHGTGSSILKPKPTRKPDPTAPKITRPCTECGKKFWSWKALFGHMRCHPERKWRGINPPENLRRSDSGDGEYSSAVTEEDQEVATCLLLLASGPTRFSGQSPSLTTVNQVPEYSDEPNQSSTFECSSCKKVFGSHQALGGHRASHKNVKGCYAINRNYVDGEENKEEEEMVGLCCGEAAGHKCGICWRVFSSGQALGGHMRCHWEKSTSTSVISSPIRVSGATNSGFDLNIPIYHDLALDLSLGL